MIETPELGDRSYVAHDGRSRSSSTPSATSTASSGLCCPAICASPASRDPHPQRLRDRRLALARRSARDYVVAADDDVSFDREPLATAPSEVGGLRVRAVPRPATPPPPVLRRRVRRRARRPSSPAARCSSAPSAAPISSRPTAPRADPRQFRSARRLAAMLGDEAQIFPTHGFGSFCSSGSSSGGDRQHDRPGAAAQRRPLEPGRRLLRRPPRRRSDRLPPLLRPYGRAQPRRALGARPVRAGAGRAGRAAQPHRAGEWVVDLRDRAAFAAAHVPGTHRIGLGPAVLDLPRLARPLGHAGHLGRREPRADRRGPAPARPHRHRAARRRGGRPAEPGRRGPAGQLPPRELRRPRQGPGTREGDGARRPTRGRACRRRHPRRGDIPLHALLERLDDAPRDRLWVHCASGYRAAIAASLLARAGHDVVLIDDEYSRAVELGLATG